MQSRISGVFIELSIPHLSTEIQDIKIKYSVFRYGIFAIRESRICVSFIFPCFDEAHNAHMQLEHTKKHISETRGIRDSAFKSKTGYTYWVCPGANGK